MVGSTARAPSHHYPPRQAVREGANENMSEEVTFRLPSWCIKQIIFPSFPTAPIGRHDLAVSGPRGRGDFGRLRCYVPIRRFTASVIKARAALPTTDCAVSVSKACSYTAISRGWVIVSAAPIPSTNTWRWS